MHYFRDRGSLNEIEELHVQRLAHLTDQLRARPVEGALKSKQRRVLVLPTYTGDLVSKELVHGLQHFVFANQTDVLQHITCGYRDGPDFVIETLRDLGLVVVELVDAEAHKDNLHERLEAAGDNQLRLLASFDFLFAEIVPEQQ